MLEHLTENTGIVAINAYNFVLLMNVVNKEGRKSSKIDREVQIKKNNARLMLGLDAFILGKQKHYCVYFEPTQCEIGFEASLMNRLWLFFFIESSMPECLTRRNLIPKQLF